MILPDGASKPFNPFVRSGQRISVTSAMPKPKPVTLPSVLLGAFAAPEEKSNTPLSTLP